MAYASNLLGTLARLLLWGALAYGGYYWYTQGAFDRWLPERYQSTAVAPAAAPGDASGEGQGLPLASDLHKIDRRFWPVRVELKKPVDFPVIKNGEQVGTVRGNPGNMVKVLALEGEKLLVENGSRLTAYVPVGDTDMIERVYELMRPTKGKTIKGSPGQYLLPVTELGRQQSEKEKF